MEATDALVWLDAHVNLETGVGVPADRDRRSAPTLDRIRELTELLGSPQLDLDAVHITGTNGKTSVARMVSALLGSIGLSTGAYTSPHLERVNERIVVDGESVPDPVLAELLTTVRTAEESLDARPSYFEVLTAAAFSWLSDLAVEAAVVEVGLGGTWDATNVLDGRIAVVTNVSVDHVEYLGRSREGIAADKAGIVGRGCTLVLGEADPALRPLFLDRGPARVVDRDRDFGVRGRRRAHGGMALDLFSAEGEQPGIFVPLHGAYQAENAAIALAASEAFLDGPMPHELVEEAFAGVRSPGRLEVVGHQPLILLDGAHNVAGAHALVEALTEEFPLQPRTIVVGLLREKDPREMLDALGARSAETIVCCPPPSLRAHDPAELAAAARELGVAASRIHVVDDVEHAVTRAREVTGADGQIVVTGSLYVVGAARAVLVR